MRSHVLLSRRISPRRQTHTLEIERLNARFSIVAAGCGVLIGCLVLTGWALNIAALKSIIPGLVAMNPATAVAFICSGVAFSLLQSFRATNRMRRGGIFLSVIVFMIGLTKLAALVLEWDRGPDTFLFHRELTAVNGHLANRMAPNTALAFVLLGLALGALSLRRTSGWIAQVSALLVLMLSFLALMGYAYGIPVLLGITTYIHMALNTALTFAILSIGVLFARPDGALIAAFTSPGVGGVMARRTLPAAVALPILLGWFTLNGERVGLYNATVGVSFMVLSTAFLFATIIRFNAGVMNCTDAERHRAEVERTQLLRSEQTARTEAEGAKAELERLNALLFQQSRYDSLTGLGNRLRLQEDLAVLSARHARYGRAYSIVLFDVDHFKAYNDRYGHQAGDAVLCQVAHVTAARFRASDSTYRYGGEEFLIILPEEPLHGAGQAAEDLRSLIQSLGIEHQGNTPWGVVSISAGIAGCTEGDGKTVDDLLREADSALYEAKRTGRNAVSGGLDVGVYVPL